VSRVYIVFFLFIFSMPLFAYIDPGTGSYIIQILIGGGITFFFLLKTQWKKFLTFVRKGKDGKSEPAE
jgi:hypothetical protein